MGDRVLPRVTSHGAALTRKVHSLGVRAMRLLVHLQETETKLRAKPEGLNASLHSL
jgi:prophage antirepressor-like protein